jgi:hypothetical protein
LILIDMDNAAVHTVKVTQEKRDVSQWKHTSQPPHSLITVSSVFSLRWVKTQLERGKYTREDE